MSDAVELSERIVVVLVQPQHPGNVGAAARAMKNMGLRRLVLVDPPAYDPERARWMAPGCDDLLAGARVVATLDEALEGVHVAVATTARHRKQGQPVLEPAELARRVLDDDRVFALLFGREDFGLATEHVLRCDSLLRIPTPEHASLNLAQAVLLVSHALFEEGRRRGLEAPGRTLGGSRGHKSTRAARPRSQRDRVADLRDVEPAVEDLVSVLDLVGYFRGTAPDKTRLTARQALQRAGPTRRHVEALRGMIARVRWALEHPEVDPKKTRND